jgi:hypothetical protein
MTRSVKEGSMARRRMILLALVALALCSGVVIAFFPTSPDRVLLDRFQQVRAGMSESEVKDILGEPTPNTSCEWGTIRERGATRTNCWFGDRFTIAVAFTQDGHVVDTLLIDELRLKLNPSVWDKIRLWFGS